MIQGIVNPGNVIPVYNHIDWQMHRQCGCKEFDWAIPIPFGESPHIQFPAPTGLDDTWTVSIIDQDGDVIPSSPLVTYHETADGTKAWVTLKSYHSLIPAGCNTFYIKFEHADLRGYRVTERFRPITFNDNEKIYLLNFRNQTDIDGILYQQGYTQKCWLLNCVWDTPEIVEPTETLTDGNAVEQVTFQSVQRRAVLRFPYLPDFWQGVFHRLRLHSYVALTKLSTVELFTIHGRGIEFSAGTQDVCFSSGAISYIESTQVITGCESNYELA